MRAFAYTIAFAVLLFSFSLSNQLTGPDIVQKVTEIMNQSTCRATMKMTIVTTSGDERTFTYDSFSAGKGEKNVIIYTSPKRVEGQATLLLNNADDIWSYFPRTDRVRKLATHAKKQKMQGSDFTYEDFGAGNSFVTDFLAERLKDEKMEGYDCYQVELTNNEKGDSKYARIVMWVIKDNFVPVVVDYYDRDDPKICEKRLTQSDIKEISGVPTAMKMTMHNNLDDSDTGMEIIECEYNVEIDNSRFTQRGFYK
jgi:outer membrane lipoprotein-sorting protein